MSVFEGRFDYSESHPDRSAGNLTPSTLCSIPEYAKALAHGSILLPMKRDEWVSRIVSSASTQRRRSCVSQGPTCIKCCAPGSEMIKTNMHISVPKTVISGRNSSQAVEGLFADATTDC